MTPEVSDFIPGSLEDKDKYTEFAERNIVIAKQKGQYQIIMCDDNVTPFIATLYNVPFAPDKCGRLFWGVTLMNLGHTCFF